MQLPRGRLQPVHFKLCRGQCVYDKVQYQWQRDGNPIDSANSSTYTLTKDDAGHKITVRATYQDNAGHDENPTSDGTDIPMPPPSGKVGEYVPKPTTDFIANVKDAEYGAKGDGQTDDAAAIQKAIDAVAEKGGGIVDIPNGTYLIDAMRQESSSYETSGLVLKSNVILRMADGTLWIDQERGGPRGEDLVEDEARGPDRSGAPPQRIGVQGDGPGGATH